MIPRRRKYVEVVATTTPQNSVKADNLEEKKKFSWKSVEHENVTRRSPRTCLQDFFWCISLAFGSHSKKFRKKTFVRWKCFKLQSLNFMVSSFHINSIFHSTAESSSHSVYTLIRETTHFNMWHALSAAEIFALSSSDVWLRYVCMCRWSCHKSPVNDISVQNFKLKIWVSRVDRWDVFNVRRDCTNRQTRMHRLHAVAIRMHRTACNDNNITDTRLPSSNILQHWMSLESYLRFQTKPRNLFVGQNWTGQFV